MEHYFRNIFFGRKKKKTRRGLPDCVSECTSARPECVPECVSFARKCVCEYVRTRARTRVKARVCCTRVRGIGE